MFVDKAIEDGFTGLQTTFSDPSLLNNSCSYIH